MAHAHWTPLSILGGSVIIAAGLYFGLRERAGSPGSAADSKSSASEVVGIASAAHAEAPIASTVVDVPASATPVLSEAAIDREAKKAVETLRQLVLQRCWAIHQHDQEMPKHINITYSGAFDATGREIGRGLSDTRDGFYAPVSTCARGLPMDLRIAPPGKNVNVVLPIELP